VGQKEQRTGLSKFDRYVLSQLLVLFGFFALILVAIYWINRAVMVFDQLIADGQSAGAIFALTALSLPSVIGIVLPIAAFASAVFVTNRLNSESELVVVQASGFSPYRLARPYLIFGILVAMMTSVQFHYLVPAAGLESERQRAELANNVTSRFLNPGEFLHPAKGVTFYIGELTPEGVLKSVFLTDGRSEQTQTTYIASEAFLLATDTGPTLVMLDGIAQFLSVDSQRLAVTRFDDFAYDIGRLIREVAPPSPRESHLSTSALLRADPALVAELGSSRTRFLLEGHGRLSQPLLSIVTAMVGFATLLLGAFSRFGVWRQIVAAIIVLILLKMLDNTASGLAARSPASWPLLYATPVVGAITVWFMLAWAARTRRVPSPLHLAGEAQT
jgi:lipopolysaccharide export system permease protein